MHKVPVGSSIAHAYEFVIQNLVTVIGTAWLPALLYGTGFFLFFQHMHDWMPAERHDLAAVVLTCVTALGVLAFTLMIRSVIGISLTQEALGVRKDFTLAHFVIGPRELRLFFAYVRFYLVMLVLYVAVLAVCVGAMYAAQHYGGAIAANVKPAGFTLAVWAAALLTIVLFVWYVLSTLRLFFLLAAVASAEHHTRLTRAWAITRGSALRILLVYLGTFLPLALAGAIGLYFLVGPDQWAAAMQAVQQHKAGAPPALASFYGAHAFIFAAATGVMSLVGGALLAGAAAHAYRAVTGHELPELEDDAALVAPLLEPETPAVVPVPVAEEAHHDHGHGHHEPAEEAAHHDDHHHGNGHGDHGHGSGGHDAHAHASHDDDHGDDDHEEHHHDDHHGKGDHGDGHHHDHGSHDHGGHHGGDGHHAKSENREAA